MTTQKHDEPDDAALEEFLQGRGELVKQLKALAQLSPSAALDAAILASAKSALAQGERSKQPAANDAVSPGSASFMSRFRMPLAMAASLMVAVLVAVQWRAQTDYQLPILVAQAPEAVAPESAAEAAPAAVEPQLARAADAKVAAVPPAKNVPAAPPPMAAAKQPVAVAESKMQASEQQKTAAQAAMNAMAAKAVAKEAPTQLAQADTSQMRSRIVAVPVPTPATTGSIPAAAPPAVASFAKESARVAAVPTPAAAAPVAVTAAAPAKAESSEKEKAWLARIDGMINADLHKDALEEWAKFQKTYPGYPVSEKFKERINALQK